MSKTAFTQEELAAWRRKRDADPVAMKAAQEQCARRIDTMLGMLANWDGMSMIQTSALHHTGRLLDFYEIRAVVIALAVIEDETAAMMREYPELVAERIAVEAGLCQEQAEVDGAAPLSAKLPPELRN